MNMNSNEETEFSYPVFREIENPLIFEVNPLKLNSFKHKFVRVVTRKKGSYYGRVATIDPVSLSILLATKDLNGKLELMCIFGHSVKKIEEESLESVNCEENKVDTGVSLEELLSVCPVLSISKPDNDQPKDEPTISLEDQLETRRLRVVDWMTSNAIPIIQQGKNLVIVPGVSIRPPYTEVSCTTNNPIIISKVNNLLVAMPKL